MHVSIIQGVVFGLLAVNILELLQQRGLSALLPHLPRMAVSLTMVALVSYQYSIFIAVFRRSLTVIDVFIPFLLGFAELAPAFFLVDRLAWWSVTTILCFAGALAFANTLWTCKKDMFGDVEAAFYRTRRALRSFILISTAAGISCLCVTFIAATERITLTTELFSLGVLTTLALFMVITGQRYSFSLTKYYQL